jgi:hypothetical protein
MASLVVPLVAILLTLGNLAWIRRLEAIGCECSNDKRRDVMKYFYYFALLAHAADAWSTFNHRHRETVQGPLLVASLAYIGVALSYTVDVQRSECACFEGREARVFMWMTILQMFVILGTVYLRIRR